MKKRLVLIADDNESIRDLYTQALSLAGINVITAKNGREAVELALSEHPDVIMMDILMPRTDGQKAVETIRKDEWGKTAKILYLTNLSEPENVFHAIKQKPEDYIIKAHTDVKEVVNKVRIALHQ